MEKKQRVCKICYRRFANGKAMGGHMRSHLVKLPVPPKRCVPSSSSTPPPPNNPSPPLSVLSCDASSEDNHMQPSRSAHYNEVESLKNPAGRRSKRLHKRLDMVGSPSESVVSSIVLSAQVPDEILSTEDAAMCLLMLSRDKWPEQKEVDYECIDEDEEFKGDDGGGGEDVDVEDDDDLFCVINPGAKTHTKYKCETCNKVFKSHQALGGHRASHKNKQIVRASSEEREEEVEGQEIGAAAGVDNDQIHQQRIFACPFCDKVFQSGQALGGHKKVHFTYLAVANKVSQTSSGVQLFDLNLPAPEHEDES